MIKAIFNQFGKPSGFLGKLAGYIMANRASNIERNIWTVSLLDIRPTDNVLEIGFGPGLAIKKASEFVPKGSVVGIDHSELMLDMAKRLNANAIRSGKVSLVWGSLPALPPLGKKFDKVFSINAYQFWDSPLQCFAKIKSIMNFGGTIAITFQPRGFGATDLVARERGEETAVYLKKAGFASVRIETKVMKPVNTICVLGKNLSQNSP